MGRFLLFFFVKIGLNGFFMVLDLSKVEMKLNKHQYERYVDFIHDVAKIFENCRLFNPAESTFCKCANALEKLFVEKLKTLKPKI